MAESDGWTGTSTLTFIGIAIAMLVLFILIESRSSHPLLPLAIIKNRNRGGAYLSSFFVGIGLFSMFLFLPYFFQIVQVSTPLQAGLPFLPFSAGIIVSAGIASQLMPRFGPRYVTFAGFALATAGMLLLTRLTPDSTYWPEVLPAMIIISLGMGLIFVPLSATALF